MDLAILFGKLLEHKMRMKRIANDEESDKNKKTPTLKTDETKDFDSDEKRH